MIITALFAGNAFAQARFDQQNEAARQRETKPAQNSDRQREVRPAQNRDNNRQRELKTVTMEGTLQLEKGLIALSSGDNVYYVPMLQRYAGFIEGIKEGAKISVEGFQFRNMLHPTKVTVSGKDYDFPAFTPGQNNFQGYGQMQRRNDFGHGQGKNNLAPRQNNKGHKQDRRSHSHNHHKQHKHKQNHRGRR